MMKHMHTPFYEWQLRLAAEVGARGGRHAG